MNRNDSNYRRGEVITRGYILLGIDTLSRAADMRMSHRHRSSLLKYAIRVLRSVNTNSVALEDIRTVIRAIDDGIEFSSMTHTEVKYLCMTARDMLKEYFDKHFPEVSDVGEDDIPF